MSVLEVQTHPFTGQKPGTSGLRKKVTEVQQKHYLGTYSFLFPFIPRSFNSPHCIPPAVTYSCGRELCAVHIRCSGGTQRYELKYQTDCCKGGSLVVGGDGRYYNDTAIQTVVKMAAANGIKKVFVAQHGLFCTPAVSATIRARKATGGLILTASHNPGGPTEDFGIKYNVSNGGPAPESVTEKIFQKTESISNYKISTVPDVWLLLSRSYSIKIDLTALESHTFGDFTVEVIDAMEDYVDLLKQIFDFSELSKLMKKEGFKFLFDALNGGNNLVHTLTYTPSHGSFR